MRSNVLAWELLACLSAFGVIMSWAIYRLGVLIDRVNDRLTMTQHIQRDQWNAIADLERSHEFETGRPVRRDFPHDRRARHGA